MVCTTEGCTDSISPVGCFRRCSLRFDGLELVDSPDESLLSNPKYFGLCRSLFVVLGSSCCKASIGAEVEVIVNSAVWFMGGGAISSSEIFGAGICEAEVEADCIVVSGGAKFDGSFFCILTRIRRALLEQFDTNPLAMSRFMCFILRSTFWVLVNSFVWLSISASVEFLKMCGPLLLIYSKSSVLRSSLMLNFAMSLFRTVMSNFPLRKLPMCAGPFSGPLNQELEHPLDHRGSCWSACLGVFCGWCLFGLLALWEGLFDISLSNEETEINYHQRVVHVRELLELPCTCFSQFFHRCSSCPSGPPVTVLLVLQFHRLNNNLQ